MLLAAESRLKYKSVESKTSIPCIILFYSQNKLIESITKREQHCPPPPDFYTVSSVQRKRPIDLSCLRNGSLKSKKSLWVLGWSVRNCILCIGFSLPSHQSLWIIAPSGIVPSWKEKFYFEPKSAICTPSPLRCPRWAFSITQSHLRSEDKNAVINLACSQKNQRHYSKWIYYLVQVGVYYLKQRDASLQSHYTFKEKPQLGWSDPWQRCMFHDLLSDLFLLQQERSKAPCSLKGRRQKPALPWSDFL